MKLASCLILEFSDIIMWVKQSGSVIIVIVV